MGYLEILQDKEFTERLSTLEQLEADRRFCRHGLTHLLDVCRIAYIMVLENGISYSKDIVYGAGLLHDIGRIEEYTSGIPHDKASVMVAEKILARCGYDEVSIGEICMAIGSHRQVFSKDTLSDILYTADKASRCCFWCTATADCKWSDEKKNKGAL